jgi:DNA-directed RNA polymerase subunit beta'
MFDNNGVQDFTEISISLASPEKIKSKAWSYGEVKRPETINYRTFKPEKDGLFCAKIFGPIKDYECLCGKYKRIKYKGHICEKCGVEVTLSKVRRERMGHIVLASPVVHIWFLKSVPSKIGLLLDLNHKDLEKVVYYENYIVVDPGITNLKKNQVINEDEYMQNVDKFGESSFKAGMGGLALKELLTAIDLQLEIANLKSLIDETGSDAKRKTLIKKMKMLDGFLKSNTRPEWMIIDVLPVMPPELRPLVPLDGGRFATSDSNVLLRSVIIRNTRLQKFLEIGPPEIILRNEKRMLQEAVDALFDNTRKNNPITDGNKRPLKSFSDMLKGKQGRFRQNLLGKRVDYSGRSVITVGPYLKLNECGLPVQMAIELYKPFVYARLLMYGYASTIKIAKKMVEKERPEIWNVLEEVSKEHPVLLNRAPTLHRLGIQAFEPRLIEGKAIHLHPLVCSAFNADFDGDQMAVHLPLSIESQLEARVLMMSTNNLLSPANGKPIVVPSQDIILGIYYMSVARDNQIGHGKILKDIAEVEMALQDGVVTLHTKIKSLYNFNQENGETQNKVIDTTPGRMKLLEIFPKHKDLDVSLVNKVLTKKDIGILIDKIYRICGQFIAVNFVDDIMALGFEMAFKAGISIGKDDLIIPESKNKIVENTELKVREYQNQFNDGLITNSERYNKVIASWNVCTEEVAKAMMKEMIKVEDDKPINSVYMMSDSGARGSVTQMKQLAGMRGLMAKPSGEIIETPIISNFKEGLQVLEYFNSTHGARKGLADTALKTANAGYLTRRLVDVSQDCIIGSEDCGSTEGIFISSIVDSGEVVSSIEDRMLGRYILENIVDYDTGKVLIKSGTYIDEKLIPLVIKSSMELIKVRSPLTCKEKRGICIKCYGRDISRGNIVKLGEAVGVVAAQSIGEPGTQLTMRTFHIGGAVQGLAEKNNVESPVDGFVQFKNARFVKNSEGNTILMSRNSEVLVKNAKNQERFKSRIPYGSKIYVVEGQEISFGTKLADWDSFSIPVITEMSGTLSYVDLVDGVSIMEKIDESTGITSKVIMDWKQQSRGGVLKPRLVISDVEKKKTDTSYLLSPNAIITVNSGQEVRPGDIIAKLPRESAKTRDITGGLTRVIELFEARKYKDAAIVSEISGKVEYGKDYKSKRIIIIKNDTETKEYPISKDRQLLVYEGDIVEKGEQITDGIINPHDILRTRGVEVFADYMINEVQSVYRMQGVVISDKHIEVIVRQMLQKVEILSSGDSKHMVGEIVDKLQVERENIKLAKDKKDLIKYERLLFAITRASLQTQSFISAASFQETTKVLTDAALIGKVDKLVGLKENIIVGRLIPAGTGYMTSKYKNQ